MQSSSQKIVIIDNYDSFTFNLYQLVAGLVQEKNTEIQVFRNDEISISQLESLNPQHIVISPGPATPGQSGICLKVIEHFHESTPILGVCLGHQAIGEFFGAKIVQAPVPVHGKTSAIILEAHPMFSSVKSGEQFMRYHSLIIDHRQFPEVLDITARTDDGLIMAVAHQFFPVWGVQFHPESFLSDKGSHIISNFLKQTSQQAQVSRYNQVQNEILPPSSDSLLYG